MLVGRVWWNLPPSIYSTLALSTVWRCFSWLVQLSRSIWVGKTTSVLCVQMPIGAYVAWNYRNAHPLHVTTYCSTMNLSFGWLSNTLDQTGSPFWRSNYAIASIPFSGGRCLQVRRIMNRTVICMTLSLLKLSLIIWLGLSFSKSLAATMFELLVAKWTACWSHR
jgi:hypothetical protein